ncbi:MAG: hypothetical protein AAFP26_11425, partial [Planctomycetota bacterium]
LDWLRERLGDVRNVRGHEDFRMRLRVPMTGDQLAMFASAFPDARVVTPASVFDRFFSLDIARRHDRHFDGNDGVGARTPATRLLGAHRP